MRISSSTLLFAILVVSLCPMDCLSNSTISTKTQPQPKPPTTKVTTPKKPGNGTTTKKTTPGKGTAKPAPPPTSKPAPAPPANKTAAAAPNTTLRPIAPATSNDTTTSSTTTTKATTTTTRTTTQPTTTTAKTTTPRTTQKPPPKTTGPPPAPPSDFNELATHLKKPLSTKCDRCRPKTIQDAGAAPLLTPAEIVSSGTGGQRGKKSGGFPLWIVWPIFGHMIAAGIGGFLIYQYVVRRRREQQAEEAKKKQQQPKKRKNKPIEQQVLPDECFKKKGALHIQWDQRGNMEHLMKYEKSHSIKGEVEIDPALCEQVQIGSDIEVIDGQDQTVGTEVTAEGSRDTLCEPTSIMASKKSKMSNVSRSRAKKKKERVIKSEVKKI